MLLFIKCEHQLSKKKLEIQNKIKNLMNCNIILAFYDTIFLIIDNALGIWFVAIKLSKINLIIPSLFTT